MGTYIDPAIVPKVKVYTGEEIPSIGMGTFVPTDSRRRKYPLQWRGRSAAATECSTARHVTETSIRSGKYSSGV